MIVAVAAAVILRIPAVIQTHGMVEPPKSFPLRLLEKLVIAPLIAQIPIALTLTENENRHMGVLTRWRCIGTIIPNGVQLAAKPLPQLARRPEVLCVGRIHPRKNVQTFVRAAEHAVEAQNAGWTFHIIGPDAGDLERVVRLARKSPYADGIFFEPPRPPDVVVARMSSAILLVQPAPREPFGLTIAEALAQGTPVVIHETSALAELVKAHEAGFTFDGTAQDLAEKVDLLVSQTDVWDRASANAWLLAKDKFDVVDVVALVNRYYLQAADLFARDKR